ncbi:Stomatin protein [mine drainage metagenome]|uniref:Stomatin protein n=1 Tax=mine drainage metagenome TaxID=410659 RepID=T1BMN7_9ZZZZ
MIVVPILQRMKRLDLRTMVHEVTPQDVISRDNVSVKVDAVIYFRIVDPEKAFIQVADFFEATSKLAQTTLRAVLGKHDLDEMLSDGPRSTPTSRPSSTPRPMAWGSRSASSRSAISSSRMK